MTRALKSGSAAAFIALVAASSFNAADAQKADAIIGRWNGEFVDNGVRTSITIDFFARGTYARRVDVISEFGWTQNGDVLLIAPAISKIENDVSYGKPSVVKMKLADDVLTISDSAQTISMKRVTVPINESQLLGRWEGQSEMNEGVTQDFLSDGRLIVTLTLAREAGRFSVDGGSITFEEQIPTPRKRKTKFRVEDGKLLMYLTPEVPALALVRVADGAKF
ncbi:MAG TPA: hypothetical protein VF042_01785 [Gemmatimonadaceae bacterium]